MAKVGSRACGTDEECEGTKAHSFLSVNQLKICYVHAWICACTLWCSPDNSLIVLMWNGSTPWSTCAQRVPFALTVSNALHDQQKLRPEAEHLIRKEHVSTTIIEGV
ncbi:hypothetical protein KIN20_004358 [Parelaphostrongylus tenuis]|uniref:Uncharacterized protein n=1 Tax=Parelaphostrongylus tenuis TaxID=148309 RepID=A0AAD5M0J4_PARTN|nr:hypothetical protein KIN20_004358 [Parelaphostrongylus tenuis]